MGLHDTHDAALDAAHDAALRDALARAVADIPHYGTPTYAALREALGAADVTADALLAATPLLGRGALRAALPKAWLPAGFDVRAETAAGRVAVVETGTGAARARVLVEPAWWRAQERRALAQHPVARRVLDGAGDAYRDALLSVPARGTGSCHAGDPSYEERLDGARLHVNSRQDPSFWTPPVMDRMLDELARHGAHALLGDASYVATLAAHAHGAGRRLESPAFVATGRTALGAAGRRTVARAFDGPVFELYGTRELGALFVEVAPERYLAVPGTAHVELVPLDGAPGLALVVATSLGRAVQPLVRYVTRDLVRLAPAGGGERVVAGIEGSLDDAWVLPSGELLTGGAVDRALADVEELEAYQAIQRDARTATVSVVGGAAAVGAVTERLRAAAPGLSVDAQRATSVPLEPDGKRKALRREPSVPLPAPLRERLPS